MQKIDLKVAHLEEREKSNTNSTNYIGWKIKRLKRGNKGQFLLNFKKSKKGIS